MLLHFFIPACFIFVFVSAEKASIPDYIHICRRSDPEVARCVRDSVEALRSRLKDGIPELNVPGLDPLLIENIAVYRGAENSMFRATLTNVLVKGASNFQVTKLKVDVNKNIYRVGIKLPLLNLDGDYDIQARILVVPINGKGRFNANITEAEGQGILKADIFEKDGYRQIRFSSFNFVIKIGDYSINLINLFNGDPVLSQAAHQVLHQSKKELIDAALPVIQQKTAEILLNISNQITKNIDYDEIFPE